MSADAVAQTNLRLYEQLRSQQWQGADLHRAVAGYELAARLLSGRLRQSGKSFLSHLVGTASIAASMGERPDVVIAALLHAVYWDGEFGDGTRGVSERKRRVVRDVAGAGAERLVAEYTATAWDLSAVQELCGQVALLTEMQRDVVVMRLANELEDHLDLGHLYRRPGNADLPCGTAAADLAARLGMATFAERLRKAVAEEERATIPAELTRPPDAPNFVPPLSHRRRMRVRVAYRWRTFMAARFSSFPVTKRGSRRTSSTPE